jgi:hypothetical protein
MSDCTHRKNYVVDSRNNAFGMRRRRECAACGERWTTIEIAFECGMPGGDPWSTYRKMAIRKHLEHQLKELRDD